MGRFREQNRELFKSGKFSDARIICQGKEWKVHKAILAEQCEWFARAFNGHWKEAETGTVRLDEEDPEVLGKILTYVYTDDDPFDEHSVYEPADLDRTPAMLDKLFPTWKLADYLLLPDLVRKIEDCFQSNLVSILKYFYTACPDHGEQVSLRASEDKDKGKHFGQFVQALQHIITHAYEVERSRRIQMMLTIFMVTLREPLSPKVLKGLSHDTGAFREDLLMVLLHELVPAHADGFFQPTEHRIFAVREAWSRTRDESMDCGMCEGQSDFKVLNPFWTTNVSARLKYFCFPCAHFFIDNRIESVIIRWTECDAWQDLA